MEPENTEAVMRAAAEALNTRVATCHERVACPRCHMPTGERCRRAPSRGTYVNSRPGHHFPPLKHPHRERIQADGTPLR